MLRVQWVPYPIARLSLRPDPRNMHIRYSQSTGDFHLIEGETSTLLGRGWAGRHEGKNKPDMDHLKNYGPLPRGWYRMGTPFKHPKVGLYSIRLHPLPETDMKGRDGFLIHGPSSSPKKFGHESEGCIIAYRVLREKIVSTGAVRLEVVR